MGTEVRAVPETAALDSAETSIGRYLARQRELRGISLDELAARTKIPLRSLARLESGAFDAKPDGFARGFVRTVALALGLDADEAVTRLLAEPAADAASAGARSHPVLAIAAVVALALIAGGAVWRSASSHREPPAAKPAPSPEWVLRTDAVRSLAAGDVPEPPPREKARAAAAPAAKAKAAPHPIARAEAAAPAAPTPATEAVESVAAAPAEPAAVPSSGPEQPVAAAPQAELPPAPAAAAEPAGETANAEPAPAADAIAAAEKVDTAREAPPSTPAGTAVEPSPAVTTPTAEPTATLPVEPPVTEIGAAPPQ